MNKQDRFFTAAIVSVAAMLAIPHQASAEKSSPWEVTGAAGLSYGKGNSDTLSYSLQLLGTYELGKTEATLGADWFYAEDGAIENTNSFRAFGEYRRLLSERFYLGFNASYLTNQISDIDYRIDASAVAGYYFLKNESSKWSFEVGPGYAWQRQGGVSDDFITLRLATRFEHQLASRSKLWFSASYTPSVDDFADNLLNVEAGIDTLISANWALRTAVRYQYDSTPAAGSGSDDTLLTVGLRYALGGIPEPDGDSGRRTLKPEDDDAPEAIQMGWSSTAALTLSMTRGNAENTTAAIIYDSAYREKKRELFLSGSYTYSESAGVSSADVLLAKAQMNHFLGERVFIGYGTGFLRDEIAAVDYRFTPRVTMGYYLVKKDDVTLSFEAGPGATFEKTGDGEDSYFTLTAAEKLVWEINSRMSFKQSIAAEINPSDSGDYTLLADVLVDTDITRNLAWRVAATWKYDNSPATGREKDDFVLSTGIAVRF